MMFGTQTTRGLIRRMDTHYEEIIQDRRMVVETNPHPAEDYGVDLEVPTVDDVQTTTGTGRTPPYLENGTATVVVRWITSSVTGNSYLRSNRSPRTWLVLEITPEGQQKNLVPN